MVGGLVMTPAGLEATLGSSPLPRQGLGFDLRALAGVAYDARQGHGFEPGPGSRFSIKLPEGDYRVTLELGGDAPSQTTIKAEARRLMLEDAEVGAGERRTVDIIVNVRRPDLPAPPANAPGASQVQLNPREIGSPTWDDRLTLEICGDRAAVGQVHVAPIQLPVLHLAGDSTVTDQPFEPAAGWGQMLPRFFRPTISVANHAESGETLKSFLAGHRLDKIIDRLKGGDWLLIQFGHNDQKTNWPQTYASAAGTYRDYLQVYVGEARRRGATPILVTPMHRNRFDHAGRIVNTHGDYPAAMRETADKLHAPLIDLHSVSAAFYEALGPSNAWKAFSDGGRDLTHHNNYGAYQLARGVVEGLRASVPDLAEHLHPDLKPFDPARPPPPESFTLPPSAVVSPERPRGN
jgi:lysophospholipase L1-like esterase